jgi:hypothetical protein
METYRIFFFGGESIGGRQDFLAEDDRTAIKIAGILHDACSDQSLSWELWQGTRSVRLPAPKTRVPENPLSDITAKMQDTIIESEEIILRSKWTISSSERLLKSLDELRALRGSAERYSPSASD